MNLIFIFVWNCCVNSSGFWNSFDRWLLSNKRDQERKNPKIIIVKIYYYLSLTEFQYHTGSTIINLDIYINFGGDDHRQSSCGGLEELGLSASTATPAEEEDGQGVWGSDGHGSGCCWSCWSIAGPASTPARTKMMISSTSLISCVPSRFHWFYCLFWPRVCQKYKPLLITQLILFQPDFYWFRRLTICISNILYEYL